MLDELAVRNLGIIGSASLEPGPRFTVVTGETGTGKTLLLGALRLLLGEDADTALVGPDGDEATVEGRFIDEGTEVVVARRLSRSSRSRAYLDGAMSSAGALEARVRPLIEIIGQGSHLGLGRPSELRALIDSQIDLNGYKLDEYKRAWSTYSALIEERDALGGDRAALERELDLCEYQAREIEGAGIADAEEEEDLRGRLRRLRNAEELAEAFAEAERGLDAGRSGIGAAVAAVRRAVGVDPSLVELERGLSSIEAGLADMAIDLRKSAEGLDMETADLELAEERLRVLTDLKRKYGASLAEVIEFGRSAKERAVRLGEILDRSGTLERDIGEAHNALIEAASRLKQRRAEVAGRLVARAVDHLNDLGFSSPHLEVVLEETEPGPNGADIPRILFASDRRLQPGELGRTASGGELSRVVLAIRLAVRAERAMVFDEVDAGVGGATALTLGRKLAALDGQVLCVTHLPQVAAFADVHYAIRRSGVDVKVERLAGAARVEELSRMLAGLPDSERGKEAAEELLDLASTTLKP